jgi:hypothetical protein
MDMKVLPVSNYDHSSFERRPTSSIFGGGQTQITKHQRILFINQRFDIEP